MTDAEQKLWRVLRSRASGAKFRRQVPLGPFVVDFVCFEARLIVELDGGQHADNPRDTRRDRYFSDQGYRVLRFWNNDVLGISTASCRRSRVRWFRNATMDREDAEHCCS